MSVIGMRKWNDIIVPPVEGVVKVTITSEEIVENIASISHYITDTSFNVDEINIRITKVLFGIYQSYLSENRSDVIYYYLEVSLNGETQSMWAPIYWDSEWHLTFNGVTLPNILNFTGVFITEDVSEDSKAEAENNMWNYLLQNTTPAKAKNIAEITYNGKTYPLDAGDKATIPCKDFKMRTDVVVKVNKVENSGAIGALESLAVEVDSIENPTGKSPTIAKYNNNFFILTEA